jgi:aryl-alcohol dehydrogenase-like predicted oxidoreductase
MKQKHLGRHGPTVSTIELGCITMSRMPAPVDLGKDAESIATIQSAIDHGTSYLDTRRTDSKQHGCPLLRRPAEPGPLKRPA